MTAADREARQLADEWADVRESQWRRGYMRQIGSHPDGEPILVLSWKGRFVVYTALLRDGWAAFCDLADDPFWSSWIVGAIAAALILAGMLVTQHAYGVTP